MNKLIYENQVKLLLDIANYMDWGKCFALKGGTAINFFYENMPRISIDMDLVYLPIKPRQESFSEMIRELEDLKNKLNRVGFKAKRNSITKDNPIGKVKVSNAVSTIKIEPNHILRGAILPTEKRSLCKKAQKTFNKDVFLKCLSYNELYAGKLNALLDRQHPRDIFDMILFFKKGNSLRSIMDIFIAYILQGNRPFSELLDPNLIDIKGLYLNSFVGMTEEVIELDTLLESREKIFNEIRSNLTDKHKQLILSFMNKNPEFDLLPFSNLFNFPAIKWKLKNIQNMTEKKRIREIAKLDKIFSQ